MKRTLFGILTMILLGACSPIKKIAYLQDAEINNGIPAGKELYITVQPKDMLSIVVSSKDPELAALFNLPRVQQTVGTPIGGSALPGQILGYTVDSEGYIDFPVLGKLHVAGLTREQIAALVKNTLIAENQIKDPVVTVDFMNLTFSVMGEVMNPGRYDIDKDHINILEALSMAGDLTIHGKRDRVFLTRSENGERITYRLDLRSSDIYDSPAFNVRQNDLIYVEPNKVRANQSTVNGNNVRSVSLWMSIASFLTTIGVLIFK